MQINSRPTYSKSRFAKRSNKNHRVLISGKHQDSRYMMRVLLEIWGYDVIEATGDEDTLSFAETKRPDLIVIDTSKVYQEELGIIRRLREKAGSRQVPILVLSAFPSAEYRHEAIEHGASGVFLKPLDLERFQNYLEKWLK